MLRFNLVEVVVRCLLLIFLRRMVDGGELMAALPLYWALFWLGVVGRGSAL